MTDDQHAGDHDADDQHAGDHDADDQHADRVDELTDPLALRDRADVPVVERTRTFEAETYDRVRDHHEVIDGVVGVGVVDDDAVLLARHGENGWAPPGGQVQPDEDWAAAARRSLRELTGQSVALDAVERLERITFQQADGDEAFATHSVLFRASLSAPSRSFRADPAPPESSDGPPVDLDWFDDVPADVNPNHEDHVRRFLNR
jgi:ADP-ribose pyrophosphatase YjhB (NUDIX family)